MQIAKENIFSRLNNLNVNNILNTDIDEIFGLHRPRLRSCAWISARRRDSRRREWHDGYCFSNADIYNLWSILNYIDEKFESGPY